MRVRVLLYVDVVWPLSICIFSLPVAGTPSCTTSPFCFHFKWFSFSCYPFASPRCFFLQPPKALTGLLGTFPSTTLPVHTLVDSWLHPSLSSGSLAIAPVPQQPAEESECLCSSVLGSSRQGCPWCKRGDNLGMHPTEYTGTHVDQKGKPLTCRCP